MTGGTEHTKSAVAKAAIAVVNWEADAPRSILFDDIYYSGDGAAETRHVFIDGNDLCARFAQALNFSIGELGFGTGLNILVAWDIWRETEKPPGARLHFLSFEKHPLSREDLARAHSLWPQYSDLSERLIAALPPPIEGVYRLRLDEKVTLTLCIGDAGVMLKRLKGAVDAWFFDGFSPAKNPDMWTAEIFAEAARLSAPTATAATFTVAGSVRRALQSAGFEVEKRTGYGRKREMLTARLTASNGSPTRAPWFANRNLKQLPPGSTVAIIGGGVAGASLAYELARSGHEPVIIDPDGIASGASGNPAGLIMPRLDQGGGARARFFSEAYFHALETIAALELDSGEKFYNPYGILLKAMTDEEKSRFRKISGASLLPDDFILHREDGLFFPQAGVIDPPKYCAALSKGAKIMRRKALEISTGEDCAFVALDDGGEFRADAVIIANGRDALRFVCARTLPLSGVMGQIDHFDSAPQLASAIAFGPYAAPAPNGGVVIGATYEAIDASAAPKISADATRENINSIVVALPELSAALDAAAAQPRAGVRCQTPDRLPVAGPIPDWSFFGAAYDDLRLGKRREYPAGEVASGLFILSGLGSRGLVTAPYAAASIVAEMTGVPFDQEISDALHPARFFIRDLKRSQRIVAK